MERPTGSRGLSLGLRGQNRQAGRASGCSGAGPGVGVTSDTLRREEMRGSRGVIVVAITVV